MSAWAKQGVKCVCVDGDWEPLTPRCDKSGPALNEICTIASVHRHGDGVWVALVGYVFDDLFSLDAFRPLITQQDDVALFTHLLTGTPVRELVE